MFLLLLLKIFQAMVTHRTFQQILGKVVVVLVVVVVVVQIAAHQKEGVVVVVAVNR
jgi:hypothetical protein